MTAEEFAVQLEDDRERLRNQNRRTWAYIRNKREANEAAAKLHEIRSVERDSATA